MFDYFTRRAEKVAKAEATSPQKYSAERLIELSSDNESLGKAMLEYLSLKAQMERGGAILDDTQLLEQAEANVRDALAQDGRALAFEPSPYNAEEDDSMRKFAELYEEAGYATSLRMDRAA